MAIVPDNLGRLSLIAQKSTSRADRLSGERQADKAQMHQSLQNLGSTLQRGRLATQAEEGMMERQLVGQEFAAGEAGLERGFLTGEREAGEVFEAGLIKEERAVYEDGSYYDPTTKKNYTWIDRPTYDAAMRSLEGDRQRNYLQLQNYLNENKDEDAKNKLLAAFDDIVNRTYGDPSVNPDPNNPLSFGQMDRDKAVETFNRYMTSADFAWLSPEDQQWMVDTFQTWLSEAEKVEEDEKNTGATDLNWFQRYLQNLGGGIKQIMEGVQPIIEKREPLDVTVIPVETDVKEWPFGIESGSFASQINKAIGTSGESTLKSTSDAQANAFALLKTLNIYNIPDNVKADVNQMRELATAAEDIADGTFNDTVMNNFLRLIGRGGTTAAPRL